MYLLRYLPMVPQFGPTLGRILMLQSGLMDASTWSIASGSPSAKISSPCSVASESNRWL